MRSVTWAASVWLLTWPRSPASAKRPVSYPLLMWTSFLRLAAARRGDCENFLYGFKVALRAARAHASGRHVRAPAPLPRARPLAPGRLARNADRAAHHSGQSPSRGI